MENNVEQNDVKKLSRLSQETQEWFKSLDDDGHSVFSNPMDDRMRQFFGEARQQFSTGNDDLFENFVKDNQARFSELLESRNKHSIFDSDNFFKQNQLLNSSPDGQINSLSSNTNHQSFIRKSEFSSLEHSRDPFMFPRYSSQLFGTSRVFGIHTNGFGDFSDSMRQHLVNSSDPPSGVKNDTSKNSYEMSSSKSMFEYCSDTNSYRLVYFLPVFPF